MHWQLGDMASSALPFFTIFLLCPLLSSGGSVAKTPLGAIQKNNVVEDRESPIFFPSPAFATQLDTVPIINPTTPGTTPSVNPIDSPTQPTIEAPPPPSAVTTIPPPVTTNPPTTTTPNPPATTTPTPTSSGGSWCIASPTASQTALQVALDYACGYGGADCSAIQSGGSCYEPNTVRDHASYAFNSYYQKNPNPTSCVFGGTAQLTTTDPSNGNCHYASSSTTPSIPPPVDQTPPTTTMPTTMTPPGPTTMTPPGPTIFGVPEPTGQPSSASSVSCGLVMLATTGILWSLLTANHVWA